MGSTSSKEIVVPAASHEAVMMQQRAIREKEVQMEAASNALKEAEETIFREGFIMGSSLAAEQAEHVAAQAAQAAFTSSLLEDEQKLAKAVDNNIAELRKKQYKAPKGNVGCQDEENAFVSCMTQQSAKECSDSRIAYLTCAEKLTSNFLKNPLK